MSRSRSLSRLMVAAATCALALIASLAPTAASAASVPLDSFRNYTSICQQFGDSCNFDEVGYGYHALAFQVAGVTPGSTVTADGIDYTWPDPQGVLDSVTMVGQTIPVDAGSATRLGFLGAAHHGPASGTVDLVYEATDAAGNTTTVTVPHLVRFSDWTLAGGTVEPVAGNTIAVTAPFRVMGPTGQMLVPDLTEASAFSTVLPIDTSMTLKAIELPRVLNIRLFDIALGD